eukprot:TRINITY_DN2457_c0_g1_i1.p1 TRINITY_DN2457_c0_g1~~TRINITY_DN2457_c0_g1_i1.p1  ORF type:complete len:870 (-),score=175.46 TRINITY_DN2457_c0_g1_i1:2142-4751(-)
MNPHPPPPHDAEAYDGSQSYDGYSQQQYGAGADYYSGEYAGQDYAGEYQYDTAQYGEEYYDEVQQQYDENGYPIEYQAPTETYGEEYQQYGEEYGEEYYEEYDQYYNEEYYPGGEEYGEEYGQNYTDANAGVPYNEFSDLSISESTGGVPPPVPSGSGGGWSAAALGAPPPAADDQNDALGSALQMNSSRPFIDYTANKTLPPPLLTRSNSGGPPARSAPSIPPPVIGRGRPLGRPGAPIGEPRARSNSVRQGELRELVKRMWVPGSLPLQTLTFKGQQVLNCFWGSEVISWMISVFDYTSPQARDTLKDLQRHGYLVAAVVPDPSDSLDSVPFRLSMPSGAIPGKSPAASPVQRKFRVETNPNRSSTIGRIFKKKTTSSPSMSATPPQQSRAGRPMTAPPSTLSASVGARSDPNSLAPKDPSMRERPTKFLRRTTVEAKKLQEERAADAVGIPDKITGDWDQNIYEGDHPDNIIFEHDDAGKIVVDCATLNALVLHLTSELSDMRFTKTFLVCFKAFVTPRVLFRKLMQRYQVPDSVPAALAKTYQVRTVNAIVKWLQINASDWDQELVAQLDKFIFELDSSGSSGLAKKLQNELYDVLSGISKELRASINVPPPNPIIPKDRTPGLSLFLNLDSLEIARQITLMDWRVFSRIKSVELLNLAWSNPKLKHRAQNVLAMIHEFNKWSNWVATIITIQTNLKLRVKVMQKFVEVAYQLQSMHNFSGTVAIISGLGNASVYRLKKTRAGLKDKYQKMLEMLEPIVDTSSSHRNYRQLLKASTPPVVPHLGVFLTDLTFMNDGNKDVVHDRLINFKKHQMVHNVIVQIRQFQLDSFNLKPVPFIQEFLTLRDDQVRDDKILYANSLRVEPRE